MINQNFSTESLYEIVEKINIDLHATMTSTLDNPHKQSVFTENM